MQTDNQQSDNILYMKLRSLGELYIEYSEIPLKSRLTVPVISIVRLTVDGRSQFGLSACVTEFKKP